MLSGFSVLISEYGVGKSIMIMGANIVAKAAGGTMLSIGMLPGLLGAAAGVGSYVAYKSRYKIADKAIDLVDGNEIKIVTEAIKSMDYSFLEMDRNPNLPEHKVIPTTHNMYKAVFSADFQPM